jgi:hypothetical protein
MSTPNGNAAGLARLKRITDSGDPAVERGLTPGMVRAIVFYETGILIGTGGHNDPCTASVCSYCGACGPGGGHGDSCPGGAWARDLTEA